MTIDIQDCDINNDYFHFTNKSNVDSILNNGLIPTIGVASKLVNDRANVSVSKGGKGIMGIINSFIYKFYQEMKISDIPEDYKKYFLEIKNFELNDFISKETACNAMIRKLKDEVYFRVKLNEEQLSNAKIGGLTGYDVNLPMKIDKSQLEIIIDENNKVLSAYDVAQYIYNKAKDIEVFRKMHNDFFYMFEM
ncbi:MAG TPA: hypothetical protein OIM45_01525 [Clostridiaceae bacterium]|nr:hypothetical protein [Clostridiaceae bacterium]